MPGETLWVARNRGRRFSGPVWLFTHEPVDDGDIFTGERIFSWREGAFPSLLPGECRRVTLTLEAPDAR